MNLLPTSGHDICYRLPQAACVSSRSVVIRTNHFCLINCAMKVFVVLDEMVLIKDIEYHSLCEHHLLPFFGRVYVAYIPDGKIIGLSKIPRIVDVFARRLQLQERLTNQIAQTIQEQLNPRGVAVVMEAEHLCMMMRGVEKQHSKTKTSAMLGGFRKDRRTRMEFMELIRSSSR